MAKRYTLKEIEANYLGRAASSPHRDGPSAEMTLQMLADLNKALQALQLGLELRQTSMFDYYELEMAMDRFDEALDTILPLLKGYERPKRGVDIFK